MKAELFADMETKRDFMEAKESGQTSVTPVPFFKEDARIPSTPNQLHTVEIGLRMNDVTKARILENEDERRDEERREEGWMNGAMEYENRLDNHHTYKDSLCQKSNLHIIVNLYFNIVTNIY